MWLCNIAKNVGLGIGLGPVQPGLTIGPGNFKSAGRAGSKMSSTKREQAQDDLLLIHLVFQRN